MMFTLHKSVVLASFLLVLLIKIQGLDLPTSIHQATPVQNPSIQLQNEIRGVNNGPRLIAPGGHGVQYTRQFHAASGEYYTTWACATLKASTLDTGEPTSSRTRNFIRAIDGIAGDQAGHIFAKRFFGPNEKWNMFPCAACVNNGDMKSAEDQIYKQVQNNYPNGLEMYVKFDYNGNNARPTTIKIMIRSPQPINAQGQHFITVWVLPNV